MSRDMMSAFELYQPDTVEGAVELLGRFGADGWALAGGNDSYDWFKDRIKRPKQVVDLSGIAALKGIRETADGVEIGALTTLTEVERSSVIQNRYKLLADAARRVASPQIRNSGTIGGNVAQDARCWYYRYGVDCYRAGGNTCYADTPEGQNREHCLWGADRCVAVSPSDTAPALVALDATMVVLGPGGQREIKAEQFFIGPNIDIERMTVLEDGDVLTAIRLPAEWSGARFYFEKVADRNTWDFPLVNIAAAMKVSGAAGAEKVDQIRIVAGAVQCVPRRLTVVEEVVRGQAKTAETASLAGQSAVRGATPLNFNHFKIPLLQNLVTRAIRDA
ncbi:MAG TPA: xanthine dehydrogenase family protein subunit M [Gammaproteobacteria bacterium]|nr:xanthine dehydrogenase family protein subunit M [Gammaproteobacteria bacterium]